jgi:hypothetical protein
VGLVRGGGAIALSAVSAGCILPANFDVVAAGAGAYHPGKGSYGVVGADVSADLRTGTSGIELGPDVALESTLIAPRAAVGHVLADVGYASAPRPFEGRFGYDVTLGVGGGTRPVGSVVWGWLGSARATVLLRVTESREVWSEDRKTTPVVFVVLGGQSSLFLRDGGPTSTLLGEYGALVGLRVSLYSNGAP